MRGVKQCFTRYIWHLQRRNSDLILHRLRKVANVQILQKNIFDIIKTVWQITLIALKAKKGKAQRLATSENPARLKKTKNSGQHRA